MSVVTVGSLFAGLGGIDLACEQAGMRVLWQCEADATARRVLAHHWPAVPCYPDVRDVDGAAVAPVDAIVFGSPCQGFSVAGRREGLADVRSGLFGEAVRIITEMREVTDGRQPVMALWENVPGALSSAHGLDFAAALDALAASGCVDLAWRIIDAQHWVPQRRRRLFTVACYPPFATGHPGAERAVQILALTASGGGHPAPCRKAGEGVATTLTTGVAAGRGASRPGRRAEDDVNVVAFDWQSGGDVWLNCSAERTNALHAGQTPAVAIAGSVTARYGKGVNSTVTDGALVVGGEGMRDALTAEGADASEDGTGRGTPLVAYSVCLGSDPIWNVETAMPQTTRNGDPGVVAWDTAQVTSWANRQNPVNNGASPTLHAGDVPLLTGLQVRRLTPRECARLQGLPDGWLQIDPPLSDAAQYRLIGNSVAVPCVRWIAARMVATWQTEAL